MIQLAAKVETHPVRGGFTIARGTRTVAETVVCEARLGAAIGRGEAVPYARYDETTERTLDEIASLDLGTDQCEHALGELQTALPAGAARNAVDLALWDLRAKLTGQAAHLAICEAPPRPMVTAYTLSLGSVADMADAARAARGHSLLKVKLGAGDGHDASRMRAVSSAAPDSRLILDANEGWRPDGMLDLMLQAARIGAIMIEQPLPAGEDAVLGEMPHPVPICADESAHSSDDLASLIGRYDLINIKLDKSGGLTEALRMRREARRLGFGVMVGCMLSSSLAMAPAVLLAQEADYADLDGPLLLAKDRSPGLSYSGSIVSPPSRELWG